jgi:hypothetical protein
VKEADVFLMQAGNISTHIPRSMLNPYLGEEINEKWRNAAVSKSKNFGGHKSAHTFPCYPYRKNAQ